MKTILIISCLVACFIGCKKDNPANAAFAGVMDFSRVRVTEFKYPSGSVDYFGGYIRCGFWKVFAYTINAGTVRYGDSVLTANSTFDYHCDVDDLPGGFADVIGAGQPWIVSGYEEMPAITVTAPSVYPSLVSTNFSSPPIIDRSAGYTLKWDNSAPGDSIEIEIVGRGNSFSTGKIAGNISEYSFTPAQLSVLAASELYTDPGWRISNDYLVIRGNITKKQTVSGVKLEVYNHVTRKVTAIIK